MTAVSRGTLTVVRPDAGGQEVSLAIENRKVGNWFVMFGQAIRIGQSTSRKVCASVISKWSRADIHQSYSGLTHPRKRALRSVVLKATTSTCHSEKERIILAVVDIIFNLTI